MTWSEIFYTICYIDLIQIYTAKSMQVATNLSVDILQKLVTRSQYQEDVFALLVTAF